MELILSLWYKLLVFGNLYEAIVFGPNWIIEDPKHLQNLNDFFVNSSPTLYFIPVTLLAAISVWVLTYVNKVEIIKREYLMASVLTLVITILTSFIVGFILSKMFGEGFYENPINGSYYGQIWNILNLFRLILEVFTIYYLFNIYRKLDKL